jgi:geranylgeranyl diphosphate synthase type I
MTTSTLAPALQRSRQTTEAALHEAVSRLDPASRAAASYHLGWTDHDGTAAGNGGGKSLRATMALLSAQAVGAPTETGLPGAVAVELVHNFSLLHDDVMDRDTHRRHRLTVWCVWGVPTAILVGDALLAAAQKAVLASGSPRACEAAMLLVDATQELIRGQHEDLAFEKRLDVSLDECRRMAEGKTGALLAASASIGAVLGDGPAEVVEALQVYGEHVGLAFQLTDDLLGIWGDLETTGKSVMTDLRTRKKTLPIAYALSQGGPASVELLACFADPGEASEAALLRVAELVEAAGGRAWALAEAQSRVRRAEAALRAVAMPEAVRQDLVSLARFVLARES